MWGRIGSIAMERIGKHAVVIGASMGGLLAARAVSEFFENVTVLERDAFPEQDVPRKGVPQGHHAHGLLARGRQVIEDFFPGWTDEVVACGGSRGDIANDVSWVGHGVTLKTEPSDLAGLLASRPVLEGQVRRRLLSRPNVKAVENCSVLGLTADAWRLAINGVRYKIAGDSAEQTMTADLVIDASGRGSASPAWLEQLGYARAEEEKIEIGISYTSRIYRRKPGDLGGKLGVVVAGNEPNWRNGAILFQTEDRWIVSFGGYFGDIASTDVQMHADYASTLPTPEFYEIVANAEPLGDFATIRHPANMRRRYERLERFPDDYLVIGDAICNFNPVYGQGMTVAAQEAALLHECLSDGKADLARRFFRAAATTIDTPWDIAVGNDLRHPQVEGPRPAKVRFINWYVGRVHQAARHDARVSDAFLQVANLQAPPERLLQPRVAMRVLWQNLLGPRFSDAKSVSLPGGRAAAQSFKS
jgi:2-polyprenyl-6-methoxyphenol hydroxylase-like FAD-dependent oxidoreductase